jgi:Ribonuclease G/E
MVSNSDLIKKIRSEYPQDELVQLLARQLESFLDMRRDVMFELRLGHSHVAELVDQISKIVARPGLSQQIEQYLEEQ